MFKNVIMTILTAALVMGISVPVMYTDANAKSFGGSRSFSSSSFSRSTYRSSGSSKPSRSLFSSAKNTSSSKPAAKPTPPPKKPPAFTGKKHTSGYASVSPGKQTRQAKAALNAQRSKFKQQPTVKVSTANRSTYSSRPAYRRASTYDRSTYLTRRNQYYGGYNPPAYVYYGSPSYGMWDTIFLYSMLSSMNNNNNASQFAYNHQNDPDYLRWKEEAEREAQNNAELRAQLAQVESNMKKYAGTPINPDFIPSDIDADIAMSQEVLDLQKPELRVCVSEASGTYFRIVAGIMMQDINTVSIVPITTHGTGEILANIANQKCDAGFVQGDGYWNYVEDHETDKLPFTRVISPYKEAVHLICNEKGPRSITKLSEKNKVWFPAGSGAAETWRNFIGEKDDYATVQTPLTDKSMSVDSYEEAITKATNDVNSCAMYVGAEGASKLMKNIESVAKSSKLVLIKIDDGDLDNTTDPSGEDVYTTGKIDAYNQLQRRGGLFGWWGWSIPTLYVNADFIIANSWKMKNNSTYPKLVNDLMAIQSEIKTAVRF